MKTQSPFINSIREGQDVATSFPKIPISRNYFSELSIGGHMIIYCIENKLNGKKYVGQHKKCNSLKEFQKSYYWGSGTYLKNSIKKHGKENFNRRVLIKDIKTKEELDHYEILWIKKLNTMAPNGYNLCKGGMGALGFVVSEEIKEKIRKKKIGKNHLLEYYKSHEGHNKGRKFGEETRKKHRNRWREYYKTHVGLTTGHKLTEEHKKKISVGNTGKKHSEEIKKLISIKKRERDFNAKIIMKKCKICQTEFETKYEDETKCANCKKLFIKKCILCQKEFIDRHHIKICKKCKENKNEKNNSCNTNI